MARRPRIHFPGGLYHVITRGNRIQGIFLDEKDMKKFLAYLVEYKSRRPFRLYAYALMKNHLHLLVEVEEIPLSRIKNTEFPLPDPILLFSCKRGTSREVAGRRGQLSVEIPICFVRKRSRFNINRIPRFDPDAH